DSLFSLRRLAERAACPWCGGGSAAAEGVAEEGELEVEEALGDRLLHRQVGDAGQGQDVVGAAGGQQQVGQAQGVGGDHVVGGQAVDEQQRAFQLGRVGQQGAAAVAVGVGGRVAQVAFAVVGVVQAPVGHRGAGHGGVEDVGAAQHGQGGQVAPERPAADGHPAEVELGVVGGHGGERLHLVVQDGAGQ